ncbi:MAG: MFS transporter [Spirochaetota bacterium]
MISAPSRRKKITEAQNGRSMIYALSLIGFFGILSTTMSKNPVLPLYVKSLGGTDEIIGLISAISPLAGIILSFPAGLLADRIGKKKLLIISGAVFASAPLLYLFVTNAFWLIPVRFFHGIATAILGPVAAAVICGAYPRTKGEKLGLYSSATLAGRSISPIAGGAIISAVALTSPEWSFRAVYIAAFIIALPVFFMTFFIKEDSAGNVEKITLSDFGSSLKEFLTNSRLAGTAFIEMAVYFTFGAFETYLPVYLAGEGYPAYEIGIIFSLQIIAIALTKPLFGRLSDSVDRRIQICGGILILGVSTALITAVPGAAAITALGIIFGLGMSLSTVATGTYIADIAKKENLGGSMGALSSIMDIGHSTGPLLTGLAVGALSYTGGFLMCSIVCAVSGLVFILLAFRPRQKDRNKR